MKIVDVLTSILLCLGRLPSGYAQAVAWSTGSPSFVGARPPLTTGDGSTTTTKLYPVVTVYGIDLAANNYEAVILSADATSTTYSASCLESHTVFCPDSVAWLLTAGPSGITASYSTTTDYGASAGSLTCSIAGTTSASCDFSTSQSISARGGASTTSTSTAAFTYSTSPLPYARISIVSGLNLIDYTGVVPGSSTPSATSSPPGATATSSSSGPAPTSTGGASTSSASSGNVGLELFAMLVLAGSLSLSVFL